MKRALLVGLSVVAFSVGQASAADIPVKAPRMAPVVAPAFTWTGCYIGGNIGGKWVRTSGSASIGPSALTAGSTVVFPDADTSTLIGGGQVGCNWQAPGSNWVFGIEGDLDWQRWSRTNTLVGTLPPLFVPGDSFDWRSNWQGSVRGRLGYAWDRFLIYATGGAAVTNLTVGTNFIATTAGGFAFPATITSESRTIWGPTVGGGVEYAFTNFLTAGIEGRYSWYGSQSFNGGPLAVAATGAIAAPVFTFAPTSQSVKLETFEVMGKINFKIF